MPPNTTSALLFIFFGILIFSIIGYIWLSETPIILQLGEMIRFILLYTSCTLVYIILYSAIEQQSPTLAIINYINQHGKSGCDDQSLNKYLNASEGIEQRLSVIVQSGWIQSTESGWRLTKKGFRIAYIFEYAATIFGLNKGG